MISYELLGKVTARRGSEVAHLSGQQQLLLARLVFANGSPVTQRELTSAIWDQGRVPDGGFRTVMHAVRKALRDDLAAGEAVVSDGGKTYQLLLDRQQVDVFRFAAKLDAASGCADEHRPLLAGEALAEWGPRAAGLFGGQPLLGLEGSWAAGTRRKLRALYRNAVIDSLRRDEQAQDYEALLGKCARLALEDHQDPDRRNPQDAMRDNDFLRLWMLAAFRSGQPERGESVFRQAELAAVNSGKPVSADLERQFQRLRDEAIQHASPVKPASNSRNGSAMSEPTINFNNSGAVIHGQFGINHGSISFDISSAKTRTPDGEQGANEKPDKAARSAGRDRDAE